MDQLWAALGGGFVAGAFLLVGNWIGGRREHKTWLRDARRSAYSAFSAAVLQVQMVTLFDSITRKRIDEEAARANLDPAQERAKAIATGVVSGPAEAIAAFHRLYATLGDVEIAGPSAAVAAAVALKDVVIDLERGRDNAQAKGASDRFLHAARAAIGTND